ncbi:MAG: hypothetical protein JNK02_08575 [Planctomycetes bacterium]|nr:hypothetical protein [Planctomycetota bacterium]
MTRSTLALALLALAPLACHSVPREPGLAVRSSDATGVLERAPIEVAVAPVVNAAGANLPAAELRAAFQRVLVERRYSPLALEYVDRRVVDAAYTPGAAEESATLQIVVESWNATLWESHSAIVARITARLVDARRPGEILWSATADQRFDFSEVREHLATEGARIRHACDRIAAEVLARLPARTARPGRTTPG